MKLVLLSFALCFVCLLYGQTPQKDSLSNSLEDIRIPNDTLYCNYLDEVNQLIYKNRFEEIEYVFENDTLYSRIDSLPFTGVIKYSNKTFIGKMHVYVLIWDIQEGIPKDEVYKIYRPIDYVGVDEAEMYKDVYIQLYCSFATFDWGRKELVYAQRGSIIGINTNEQQGAFKLKNGASYYITGDTMSTVRSQVADGVLIQEEKIYELNHKLKSESITKDNGDTIWVETIVYDFLGNNEERVEKIIIDSAGVKISYEKEFGEVGELKTIKVVKRSGALTETTTQLIGENGQVKEFLYFAIEPNRSISTTLIMKNEVDTSSYIYELTRGYLLLETIAKVWDYELKERTTTFQLSSKSTTEEKTIVYNWETKISALIVIKTDQIDTWGYTAWINEVNDTIQKYPFLNDRLHGTSYDRFDHGGYNYVTLELQWNKGRLIDVVNPNVILIKGYKKIMTEDDFLTIVNRQKNGPVVYPIPIPLELHGGLTEDFILFTERSFRASINETELYDRLAVITKKVRRYRMKYSSSS